MQEEAHMEKQNILFDLDDTLVHCNKYFYAAIDGFALMMNDWFSQYSIPLEQYKEKQLELDLAGVHIHGFMKDRFPQSLIETYDYFIEQTGRNRSLEEEELLFELGSSVYDQQYEAYPNMEQTLKQLQDEGHKLSLYTGGDAIVQSMKVEQLKLDRFFGKKIYISQHKTTEVLENIIVENKMERTKTWMIGNSARTDILPALKAGIHSIYIPIENEWKFNIVSIDIAPKGAFITLASLDEVPNAIRNYTLNLA